MMKKAEKRAPEPRAGLTRLGSTARFAPGRPQDAPLEAFANPNPDRDYWIEFDCPEFTALCPITGQPDFGRLLIRYVPDQLCVESKSLKLYLFAYRNHGAFHEAVCNRILDDLVKAVRPRRMILRGEFNRRGGIAINVEVAYTASSRRSRRA